MKLHLEKTLGISKQDIANKKYNIWVGISLGNKSFTPEAICQYVKWGLQNTGGKVIVLLVDTIHRSNYKILSSKSGGEAERLVQKKATLLKKNLEEEFVKQGITGVPVLGWDDVVNTEEYQHNLKEVKDEFKYNKDFRDDILGLVKQARKDKIDKIKSLNDEEINELVSYPLSELALFVNPIRYRDTSFQVSPYPVHTRLDDIVVGVNRGSIYEDLSRRLDIIDDVGSVIASFE